MTIAKQLLNILTGIVFLLFSICCSAQVRFTAVADQQQIARDAVVKVEFIIENANSIENFKLPGLKNFKLLSGPEQGSGMSIVNGVLSKYSSVVLILQPAKTGKLSIPSATAVINGKKMQTNPLLFMVGNYSAGSSQPPAVSPFTPIPVEVDEQYELLPGENVDKKIKDNLLVKLETDKVSCYEGEPVIATYKLCSRLKSESRVTKRPSLNGFSVYDMIAPENASPTIEKVNGKLFNVHMIRKAQLYPLQAGVFELEPVELENKVRFLRRQAVNSSERGSAQQLADEFRADNYPANWEEHNITFSSKPIVITVKSLPDNKPESFNGAVGRFSIEADITPKELHANETAVLRVIINGEGNLPLITSPAVNFPPGIELFGDAVVKEFVDKNVAPIRGSKSFEYSFIPTDSGNYEIPAVSLAFFDPAKESYQNIETGSITLKVLPAKKLKTTDKFKDQLKKLSGNDSGMKWVWIAVSAIALLVLIVTIFKAVNAAKRKRELKNIVIKPNPVKEEMVKIPVYPFQKARDALTFEDHKPFYSSLQQSLWSELSSNLQLPITRLNHHAVIAELKQRNKDTAIVDDFELLANECEMALYTPVYTSGNRQEALDRAERILAAIRPNLES